MDDKFGTLKLTQDVLIFEGDGSKDSKNIPIGAIDKVELEQSSFEGQPVVLFSGAGSQGFLILTKRELVEINTKKNPQMVIIISLSLLMMI